MPPVNETKTSISSLLFSDAAHREGEQEEGTRAHTAAGSGVWRKTSDNTNILLLKGIEFIISFKTFHFLKSIKWRQVTNVKSIFSDCFIGFTLQI